MVIILKASILFRGNSPWTTSVKFCSLVPMELLAIHTYTPESFTIRFPRVYCSISICELPDMVLRTTSPSSFLLLISTDVTGGTASTVHSRSRLVDISLLTTPGKNWTTGIAEQKNGKKKKFCSYLCSLWVQHFCMNVLLTGYLQRTVTSAVALTPSTISLLVAVHWYTPLSLSVTCITTSSLLATCVAFSPVELIMTWLLGVMLWPFWYQ